MPIQINLLAEAQALEEQRRRDPVKRVILAGSVLVVLILVWSSSLMVKTMLLKGDLNRDLNSLNSRTNEYRQILANQRKLGEDNEKLEALRRLASSRFLVGNLLDALQKTTVDNVQLVRLKIDQAYTVAESQTNETGSTLKPVGATERIVLTLNAKDTSPTAGDAVSKFQDALSSARYFQEILGKTSGFRLTALGSPQTDPEGKSLVLFTIEARFPDKTR
jgi:hypothetical protein